MRFSCINESRLFFAVNWVQDRSKQLNDRQTEINRHDFCKGNERSARRLHSAEQGCLSGNGKDCNKITNAAGRRVWRFFGIEASQIQNIRQEKISGDNIYQLLLAFYEVYGSATEVEQKGFMRAFIERIDLYPEKQKDGN